MKSTALFFMEIGSAASLFAVALFITLGTDTLCVRRTNRFSCRTPLIIRSSSPSCRTRPEGWAADKGEGIDGRCWRIQNHERASRLS